MNSGGNHFFRNIVFAAAFGWLVLSLSASAWAGVTITRTSAPDFYMDAGMTGQYVSYQIYNAGPTPYYAVWVEISNFTGGIVSLSPLESSVHYLEQLPVGNTKTAYFYLLSSGPSAVAQTHTINVYEGKPPGTPLTGGTATFTLSTVINTIAAAANKVNSVVSGPTPPILGGIVTITVDGDTGTLGSSKLLSFSPACYPDWPSDAFEFFSTTVTLTGGNTGTYQDTLYFTVPNTATTHYVVVYQLRARSTTSAPSTVSPLANIASGTQIKHTSTSNFGTFPPILPSENCAYLAKNVSPNFLPGAGYATYTITFTNVTTQANVFVDEVIDQLPTTPGSANYVTNSARFMGSIIRDPFVSGNQLTWYGPLTVPANGTSTLSYVVNFPTIPGFYTNQVVGRIGDEQIDTTLNTTSSAPASVSLCVPTPTATPTSTSTSTSTSTQTATPTYSPSRTASASITATPTQSGTFTITPTSLGSDTASPTVSASHTPTISPTPTVSLTKTVTVSTTPTFTETQIDTATPTFTLSSTGTPTAVNTATFTFSETKTMSPTGTASGTPTTTPTSSSTSSETATVTPINTYTETPVATKTFSETATAIQESPTCSATCTVSPTIFESQTGTATSSGTATTTCTATRTPASTLSFTPTASPTLTAPSTFTQTPTAVHSPTPTSALTAVPSSSATLSVTRTPVPPVSPTATDSPAGEGTKTSTPVVLQRSPTPEKLLSQGGGCAQPNPFFPHRGQKTRFGFAPENQGASFVIRIYTIKNRLVRTLENRQDWDGRDSQGRALESGVYIYQIESGPQHQSGTVVLIMH